MSPFRATLLINSERLSFDQRPKNLIESLLIEVFELFQELLLEVSIEKELLILSVHLLSIDDSELTEDLVVEVVHVLLNIVYHSLFKLMRHVLVVKQCVEHLGKVLRLYVNLPA